MQDIMNVYNASENESATRLRGCLLLPLCLGLFLCRMKLLLRGRHVLGTYDLFEERQVGHEWFNIFSGCSSGWTTTIVLRGGADQFIEEAERSLHGAIMIVRRALKNSTIVTGGGDIDMEMSYYLRQHAHTIAGKSQLFIYSYAKGLEVIPRQLCHNAGFDATDVLNKLRQKHALPSGLF